MGRAGRHTVARSIACIQSHPIRSMRLIYDASVTNGVLHPCASEFICLLDLLLHDRPDDRNHHLYDDGKAKHAQ